MEEQHSERSKTRAEELAAVAKAMELLGVAGDGLVLSWEFFFFFLKELVQRFEGGDVFFFSIFGFINFKSCVI